MSLEDNYDDDSLHSLIDEKEISKRRAAAEEKYRDLTTDQITSIKRRCKTDLYFLAHGPLEYTKLSPLFHGHFVKWLRSTWGEQYRLILQARGHYKSTLATIADGIQMALPNDLAMIDALPYAYGPDIKLLLAHEVRETAAKFLYEITAAFTSKELMLALFPECIPTKRKQRLNKLELELPRNESHKEPTFSTLGAGGAAQGNHFHWLKLDDLIGEDARDSPTTMKRVLTWFDNVNALLTDLEIDGWDLVGTRWTFADVYSHAMEVYGINTEGSVLNCIPEKEIQKLSGGELKVYARGALENGVPTFPVQHNSDGKYISGFSLDKLNILRKNALVWAAQYANNPMESGLQEFEYDLRFYNLSEFGKITVFGGDESFTRRVDDFATYIFCDPSMGETETADDTGIVVTGVDHLNQIFVLETVKQRLRPPDLIDELIHLNNKYHPEIIAIEEVNFSGIYRYWIQEKSVKDGLSLPVRAYKPGSKRSKEARIRGLANYFAAGQIFLHESQHDLIEEYQQFPLAASQHLLDALAQGPDFWSGAISRREMGQLDKVYQEILNARSSVTGY